MSRRRTLIALAGLVAGILTRPPAALGEAGPVRLVSADAHRLVLDIDLSRAELRAVDVEGRPCLDVVAPGLQHYSPAGHPDVPFTAQLLAVPPGARVRLRVLEERVEELEGVTLAPAPNADGNRRFDPTAYDRAALSPASVVVSEDLGVLRGVRAHALRVYPVQYAAAAGRLRLARHLRIEVRFEGGAGKAAARPGSGPGTIAADPLHAAFLNPPPSSWRLPAPAPRPLAGSGEWYDPARPWVKVRVDEDGVYRLTAEWLRGLGIEGGGIDPRTLRLLYLGEEQHLQVTGGEDGRLDDGDEVLFYGRYRRGEGDSGPVRDFDSPYGRTNTYWLTWGGAAGRRFETRSAAPVNGYPQAPWYATTTHVERDCSYQQFEYAPDDALGDHWFWQCGDPSRFPYPDRPGAATFTGDLSAPWLEEEYPARLRVGLHGHSVTGQHHNFIKLNGEAVTERIWEGQVAYVIDEEVPSSYLKNGTNRVVLQGLADLTRIDLVWFNWFAVDHRRHYYAWPGFLAWDEAATEGRSITLFGFPSAEVELFDVANGLRLTGLAIGARDSTFTATFEDRSEGVSHYVAADRTRLRTPAGQVDEPSAWRDASNGADYIILTHPLFAAAARELAAHRQRSGLQTAVVLTEDVYDEFAYGRFTSDAIADFIAHAYHHWQVRPAYVLLLGDGTWDYRNIYGSYVPSFVPTRYYHARSRGISPSDYFYALVDGDDLLADLAIGRFGVETAEEAAGVVRKVIAYDLDPAPGDWRSRAVYTANYHAKNEFSDPSDSLAARYTEPLGLRSVKVYDTDEAFLPKPIGRDFLEALNAGSLTFNFSGHGAAGGMWPFFTIQGAVVGSGVNSRVVPDWDYLSQVDNGRRLPVVVALSCLNGMFVHPHDWADALAEVFTSLPEGGAIAYISATAIGYTSQYDLLGRGLFQQLFEEEALTLGPALNVAKARVLAAHSSFVDVVETMQLFGDPAQELSLAPMPEYEAVSLAVDPVAPTALSTARVRAVVRNNTRLGADSVAVALLALDPEGSVDTLAYLRRAAFTGTDTIEATWAPGAAGGARRLALSVDDAGAVAEADEGDNRIELVVDVLEAVVALPVFPPEAGQVPLDELVFEASVPVDADLSTARYACQFALDTDPGFGSPDRLGATVSPRSGRCDFRPGSLPESVAAGQSPLYWRVRIVDGAVPGTWSATRTARVGAGAGGGIAAGSVRWMEAGDQLLGGLAEDLSAAPGGVGVSSAVRPFRPASATRQDGFTVRDLAGAGVLCADGTYLYAKRWFNDASTVYPGTDFFTRIGTGFNGTHRDGNYGVFGDSTTAGISATYHADGYIYSESGRAYELERLDTRTGHLDTVAVPDGLLEWKYGRVEDGHSLITSDGRLIYNVSMSTPRGTRTAWGVRVFDPAAGWRLVRAFTSPPTATAFTFEWTDGLLADGQHLYFIEYGGQHRVRMVDAVDGAFLDEWRSDQDTTRVISGQYDWANNQVWLGDLMGPRLFRYAGVGRAAFGRLTSAPVGPASAWHRVQVDAAAGAGALALALQSVDAAGAWGDLPGYRRLVPGQAVDLSGLDADAHPWLRLRAELSDSTGTAHLEGWRLDFRPRPSLELAGVTAAAFERAATDGAAPAIVIRMAVRNRSPLPVAGVALRLELDDGALVSSHRLDTLGRGILQVIADTVALPALGRRLFAVVETAEPDADPADNRLAVPLLFEGRAPLAVRLWPADRAFLDGDPLGAGEGLVVTAPPVRDPRLVLALDGEPVSADSLLPEATGFGLRALLRPQLSPGRHRLQARLFSGLDEIGLHAVEFRAVDGLSVSSALVHPHPVTGAADFTFVLSAGAEVAVELFTLAGHRVRHLGPQAAPAGFGRISWDGRAADGGRLAAGTYLYVLRVRGADGHEVIRRRPFTVLR